MSQGPSPAGLYWSSTHLVQCKLDEPAAGQSWSSAHFVQYEPDELSWTGTQTWVQMQMPDYSLNLTKGSSTIKWCQCCHRPPTGGSAETGSHSTSNLFLTLKCERGIDSSSGPESHTWFVTACCVYIVSDATSLLGWVKRLLCTGSSFKVIMKYFIVLWRGTFKYDVFYPVITNCFRKARRINPFWQRILVLKTEVCSLRMLCLSLPPTRQNLMQGQWPKDWHHLWIMHDVFLSDIRGDSAFSLNWRF